MFSTLQLLPEKAKTLIQTLPKKLFQCRRCGIRIFMVGNGLIWVCLKMLAKPLNPMVLLIIIPMKNGYFIGNIPYFQTNPFRKLGRSCTLPWFLTRPSRGCSFTVDGFSKKNTAMGQNMSKSKLGTQKTRWLILVPKICGFRGIHFWPILFEYWKVLFFLLLVGGLEHDF